MQLRATTRTSKLLLLIGGVLLVVVVAFLDAETGTEVSLSALYLVPILLGAWYGGRAIGLTLSVFSAIDWSFVGLAEVAYSSPAVPYWNSAMRLVLYATVTLTVTRLQDSIRKERELSRADPLTGAANGRTFQEWVEHEIKRARRTGEPFTVSYMDLDNFKEVNDRFGHPVGDQLLITVASTMKRSMRATDLVARLGGDEFAIFQPATDSEGARASLGKLREAVVAAMKERKWAVTLSIGSVTFRTPPEDSSELIRRADKLLYIVKQRGKNDVLHEVVGDRSPGA